MPPITWANTIQQEYCDYEDSDDIYDRLSEDEYIAMSQKSAESHRSPASEISTLTSFTTMSDDGDGTAELVPKENSNGSVATNGAGSPQTATPSEHATEDATSNNVAAHYTEEANAEKTTQKPKKSTASATKKRKTPAKKESEDGADATQAAGSARPKSATTIKIKKPTSKSTVNSEENKDIEPPPAKSTRSSAKRKAEATDDEADKQDPAKKKIKRSEKGLRSIEVIKREFEEQQTAEKRAQEAKEAEQQESNNVSVDKESSLGQSTTDDKSQEQINTEAGAGNDHGEQKKSSKQSKKRKADSPPATEGEEPKTAKRTRTKQTKILDANDEEKIFKEIAPKGMLSFVTPTSDLPTALSETTSTGPVTRRKLAPKGARRASLKSPPEEAYVLVGPEPTELTPALQAKVTQINTFINSHPEADFDRTANRDREALTISELTLQSVVQIMYTHYGLTAPDVNVPLSEIEKIVLGRSDSSEEMYYPITIEIAELSQLEERIQAALAGHGLEGKNLLKIEIEMFESRMSQEEEGEIKQFRVIQQAERLLEAMKTVDEKADGADVVEENLGEMIDGEKKVMGVCPRPMVAI